MYRQNQTPPTWRTLQLTDRNGKCEDLTCSWKADQLRKQHWRDWCVHNAAVPLFGYRIKKIIASSFLAPTTFGEQYCLPLIFWPKLAHPAARSLSDSWATCIFCFERPATSKTGIGSVVCVVPIPDIIERLSCVSPHMVVYDREMLPRRLHYITSDRIGDVVMLMDEDWQVYYR